MQTILLVVVCGFTVSLIGCMDDTSGGEAGQGGNQSASSSISSSGGGEGGAGGSGGSSSGPPQAPVITMVEPLQGGLHVMWDNVTMNCDKIELDRNKDGSAYATAYTLVGVATSQHDASAVSPGTYCYKARCLKGAETSPDSNEKCGTP